MPYALCQIQGWQTAEHKLPTWAGTPGVIYPPRLSMEQCSSEPTAHYKATILPPDAPRYTMTDLTGGFGVDATILARAYSHLTFVETSPELCQLARHNLPLLGIHGAETINARAEQVITELPHQNLIYIDPARRDDYGRKMVQIQHCTPDLTILQDLLLDKCDHLLVKLSPMLDIHHILHTLHHIHSLHVVSLQGECKEIVVHMSHDNPPATPLIHAVNIKQKELEVVKSRYRFGQEVGVKKEWRSVDDTSPEATSVPLTSLYLPFNFPLTSSYVNYLYEPNASIMKAQLFDEVARQYCVHQLHPNSHLFISKHHVDHFPGRTFVIQGVYTLSKQHICTLRKLKRANISVRNFPMTTSQLRQRLLLADGGDTYLMATTINPDEQKVILCCTKCD